MTRSNRRRFLASTLGGLAGAYGLSRFGGGVTQLAQAAASAPDIGAPDRYYIFCYFSGGWDVLLSLDPRDPSLFSNSAMATTRIQPGYELLDGIGDPYADVLGDNSMRLGPYMGELGQMADRLTVVRGMSMDTLTHEVGRRRFLTGRPPSGLKPRGASTDAWLASSLGGSEPIPNLSVGVESYNPGDLPNYATALKANGINDLQRVLRADGPDFGSYQDQQLNALLSAAAECPATADSPLLDGAAQSRLKAAQMVEQNLFGLFNFGVNTPEMVALRSRYGINGVGTTALNSSNARAATAATAIMNGVSRCVSVRINVGSLDTHFQNWETDQGRIQRESFNAIARMATHLQETPHPDGSGDSWLDRTVIVGFSEFSRTPLLNNNGGRDHWLGNSCFLLGGKVARGKVVGGSSNVGMNPLPVDLKTGDPCAIDPEMASPCPEVEGVAEVVRPEHVLQALFHEVGLTNDEPDLRVEPLSAILV